MKTNCSECLNGNCGKCKDDNCLCRESHSLCKQCKKKPKVGGSFLGDFCSPECQYEWHLTDPKSINEEYNDSAKLSIVEYYLTKNKKYREIIYSLKSNNKITFPFNPIENHLIMEFYLQSPEDFIPLVKAAIIKAFLKYNVDGNENQLRETLTVHLTESSKIRMNQWGAEYEGFPVEVACQIIGSGVEKTYLKQGEAVCPECGSRKRMVSLGMLPDCTNDDCKRKYKEMIPDQKTIRFGDMKTVQIQEPMEETKHGTPTMKTCIIKDEYVKSTFVGQRKKMIGVFRSQAEKGKLTHTVIINTISMDDLDNVKEAIPTDNDIAFFKSQAKKQNFLDIVSESIAPEIMHETLAKTCTLLSMIGGTAFGRLRGDIHSFLVGNPGDGKTSILMFTIDVVEKSAFVNGRSEEQ